VLTAQSTTVRSLTAVWMFQGVGGGLVSLPNDSATLITVPAAHLSVANGVLAMARWSPSHPALTFPRWPRSAVTPPAGARHEPAAPGALPVPWRLPPAASGGRVPWGAGGSPAGDRRGDRATLRHRRGRRPLGGAPTHHHQRLHPTTPPRLFRLPPEADAIIYPVRATPSWRGVSQAPLLPAASLRPSMLPGASIAACSCP